MERQQWKKISVAGGPADRPCPRWGHSCCSIGQDVVYFGGYADSNYMNDIWVFRGNTLKWEEVITSGTKPMFRSNCSMSYDPTNNKIVIFGGGGSNKARFNTISLLDWTTKLWTEIVPKQNQPAPWERTYHTAELAFPYLVVYGGEGLSDLDDLWVFDFISQHWTEVRFGPTEPKPCARRFHASAMVNNEMFVIAGCHSKYRCLCDIYSLDLKPLLLSKDPSTLKWQERKVKDSAFLTRWGHSTAVYDNKVYIFGGRFSNDLNDLLIYDPLNDTIRSLKTGTRNVPNPRRRHCAGFLGSSMIIFGGFNGEYFNDLHYINVFELTPKALPWLHREQKLKKMLNTALFADAEVTTTDGKVVYVHKGLICACFKYEGEVNAFLESVKSTFTEMQLLKMLEILYVGYGTPSISSGYGWNIQVPAEYEPLRFLETSEPDQPLRKFKNISSGVIVLKDSGFQDFLQKRRNCAFWDSIIEVGNTQIRANRAQISYNCEYLRCALRKTNELRVDFTCPIILEIMLAFLQNDFVVVPDSFTFESWISLCELAEYHSLTRLLSICEAQLCSKLTVQNKLRLLQLSLNLGLFDLELHCVDFNFRSLFLAGLRSKQLQNELLSVEGKKSLRMKHYLNHKFDLINSTQTSAVCTRNGLDLGNKGRPSSDEEKENNELVNI